MTYKEIAKKFKDKWVLVAVEKEDSLGQILEGRVLVSGKTKKPVHNFLGSKSAQKYNYLATLFFGSYRKKGWAVAYYGRFEI